jgi:mannosyl-oligosaccharide glucosidase
LNPRFLIKSGYYILQALIVPNPSTAFKILGLEARAKVPDEFVVQKNTNANPPTLLLTLHSMVHDFKQKDDQKWFVEYLRRIWPRLEVWYNWFNQTQNG